MKLITFSATILAAAPLYAAVTPVVNFQPGLVDAIFQHEDTAYFSTSNQGYYFYGTFSTVPTTSSTAQQIEDDFRALGISGDSVNPDMSGYTSGKWSSSVEEADFASQRGYLVVANNADIGSATSIAVATNLSDPNWSFSDFASPYTATISVNQLSSSTTGSSLIIGSYDASSPEGILLAPAPVPEPSSFALLGLGALALTFRRKK